MIDGEPGQSVAETGVLSILLVSYSVTDTDPDMGVQLQGCFAAPYRRQPRPNTALSGGENHLETFLSRCGDGYVHFARQLPHLQGIELRFMTPSVGDRSPAATRHTYQMLTAGTPVQTSFLLAALRHLGNFKIYRF